MKLLIVAGEQWRRWPAPRGCGRLCPDRARCDVARHRRLHPADGAARAQDGHRRVSDEALRVIRVARANPGAPAVVAVEGTKLSLADVEVDLLVRRVSRAGQRLECLYGSQPWGGGTLCRASVRRRSSPRPIVRRCRSTCRWRSTTSLMTTLCIPSCGWRGWRRFLVLGSMRAVCGLSSNASTWRILQSHLGHRFQWQTIAEVQASDGGHDVHPARGDANATSASDGEHDCARPPASGHACGRGARRHAGARAHAR